MVKQLKVIAKIVSAVAILASPFGVMTAFADDEKNTNFQVNVKESLAVSISTPTEWASGDADTFLRNKVSVNVNANNANGFVATMTTKTDNTSLVNTSKSSATLPTLSGSFARANFPANYWGYSFDDTENGSNVSTYNALVGASSTPITVLSSNTAASGSRTFYFGAKANMAKEAGTYVGTVVINVVTGVIDDNTNPVVPTNPVSPDSYNVVTYNTAPTGGSSNGTTSYSYQSTGSSSNVTTTEISDGNNVDLYNGYTPPQGELYSTFASISDGSILATGLAITASVAAASGIFFFILAKRRDDDDEDEDVATPQQ